MSVSRTWLVLCLAAAACSSKTESKPKPAETAPAAAVPAAPKPAADEGYDSGSLGALTFALSEGTPEARAHFMRGLLALHSFWYDEAIKQFQAAIDADPKMNMAYWGAAMSRCKLLWGDDDLADARQILARMPDPDHLPEREQAWILATADLLTDDDVRTSRKKFAAAMETLNAQFPDDESATFLAIALLATTRPEDPDTLDVRKRAAALALGVYQHNPKHPGAAHYLIHAYDTPELASLALPYAREYAKLAPAAFHARHMPAHIFSRLGMWKDAIDSCQSAWDVSVAAARREKLSADHDDFHSLSWLVDMNFELGHRKAADAALAVFATTVRGGLGHSTRTQYATEVASYMARTGEWSRVDELLAPLDAPPTRTMGAGDHCAPGAPGSAGSPLALFEQVAVLDARARAAAMQADLGKTKQWLAEVDAVRQKLRPFLLAMQPKEAVAKIDASNARTRTTLLARAGKDDAALLKVLRESASDADRETGGESNPSGFLAHEEIADTLLRLGQAKAAAAEYAIALDHHPGRGRSILGAARALTRAGDAKGARARYQQLLELWTTADDTTDGLAEARAAVATP